MYFCNLCKQMVKGEPRHYVTLAEDGDEMMQSLRYTVCPNCLRELSTTITGQPTPPTEPSKVEKKEGSKK